MAQSPGYSASDYMKLSPALARAQGKKPSSKNFILKSDLAWAQAGHRVSAISQRQHENLKNVAEFRKPISREARAKLIHHGKAKYRTKQAAEAVKYKRRTDSIRRQLPTLSNAEIKLIDKRNMALIATNGDKQAAWNTLSRREQSRFNDMFDNIEDEYDHDLHEAVGSPMTE